ncbi:HIT family protein [Alkalicoccus chagannorensis]|uniref:HIT family protein n=1 Tax=Alkalicoccus chagannorensis TaxID=427072 RepID=UPI0004215546|nr:HIT family protein [Alkalicoccus chagannorensis]
MSEQSCIFCSIIKGDIPSAKVYEDEHVYAFLDLSQVTKGHTLLIPKKHEQDIFHLEPETASRLFQAAPVVAKALDRAFVPAGLNVLNNNKEAAGQSVFHYHLHLIPRYDQSDGFQPTWVEHGGDYSQEELQQLAAEAASYI